MFILKVISPTSVEQIQSAVAVTFYPADSWQGSRVVYFQKGDKWSQTIDRGTVYVMSESGATLAEYVLGSSTIEDAKRKADRMLLAKQAPKVSENSIADRLLLAKQAITKARLNEERKRDSVVVRQAEFLLEVLLDPKVYCTANIRHAAEVLQREIDTWNRHYL